MFIFIFVILIFSEEYIHWIVLDNQTSSDVTSVRVENFLFNNGTRVSSQGLMTFYNCTIGTKIFVIDLYRSQNEILPSYQTRKKVMSQIEQNKIQILNSRFQEKNRRRIHVFIHLYEGARIVQIIDCNIENANIYINIGNLSLSKGSFAGICILNLDFEDSSISNTVFRVHISSQDSFGSVELRNGVLHDTRVWKYRPGGFAGFPVADPGFPVGGAWTS